MTGNHQLAAIMFTDIVGFTKLMGEDEVKTMATLKKNREIHQTLITNYNGRLLKEMGDGMLAYFTSVLDAVHCAGKIREEARKADYPLKIGIHLGEIIMENDDVYGDGVNIASRIQDTGKAGQILVSETVHANVQNKPGITSRFQGERQLKNVKDPVRIYAIDQDAAQIPEPIPGRRKSPLKKLPLVPVLAVFLVLFSAYFLYDKYWNTTATKDVERSIAIMPFKNLSPDPDMRYIADGLRLEIYSHLTKISDLSVSSSRLKDRYRDNVLEAGILGKELGVKYILEASFQGNEDQVKLIVNLTNTADGSTMWSETFTKNWGNIITVQSEIATAVIDQLRVLITPGEMERIIKIPGYDPDAYRLYTQGMGYILSVAISHWEDTVSITKADSLFSLALQTDPEFALAYYGKAEVLDAREKRKEHRYRQGDSLIYYCKKALSLDSTLAEAHSLWAFEELGYPGGTYENALYHIDKAIDHNPGIEMNIWTRGTIRIKLSDPIGAMGDLLRSEKMAKGIVFWYRRLYDIGQLYRNIGDHKRAEKFLLQSRNARKDALETCLALERLYQNQGNFEKARLYADTLERYDRFFTEFGGLYVFQQMTLQHIMQNYNGAYQTLQDLLNAWGIDKTPHPSGHWMEGFIYFKAGETTKAMERFNSFIDWTSGLEQPGPALAGVYAFLGRKDEALEVLRKYAEETHWIETRFRPIGWLDLIQIHPIFESLWEDEEFKEIVEEGVAYKAEVRARIDKMADDEDW